MPPVLPSSIFSEVSNRKIRGKKGNFRPFFPLYCPALYFSYTSWFEGEEGKDKSDIIKIILSFPFSPLFPSITLNKP